MVKTKAKKGVTLGLRVSANETFSKTVQDENADTEKALKVLASIRLKEAERDLILNPPIHERVAGNS